MFEDVNDTGDVVTVSFRGLNALACNLASQLATPDAGPTAWRFAREYVHGRGWQSAFSVWQNFPGNPGARAMISPQENEVTIWPAGEKGVTTPFRNWQRRTQDAWWKACLAHLRPFIPGTPDVDFVYQLANAAAAPSAPPQTGRRWRILWATPSTNGPRSHSPYGPGGLIPCLQVAGTNSATATFGEGVIELREPGAPNGEVLEYSDPRLMEVWAKCCAAGTSVAEVQPEEQSEDGVAICALTFVGEEAEAFRVTQSMVLATPGYPKWSITRERPDEPPVMRVLFDWPGK